jgi:UDP-glucose 4-epimerase
LGIQLKISILGGAGFIGTNLAILLSQNGHEISIIDNLSLGNQIKKTGLDINVEVGDISNATTLMNFLERNSPERIYHLAANSDIKNSALSSDLDLKDTFLTTSSLVACAQELRVDELVFASSSAIYGESLTAVSENDPKKPISAYGWMKLASEELLRQSAHSGHIKKLLIARFPNVTGLWQTHGVIFDFLNQLKHDKHLLNVLGDGYQDKPYILASDLVSILEILIDQDWNGAKIVNISPDSSTSVRKIVELICEICGLSPQINYGNSKGGWVGDVPTYKLDTEFLYKEIKDLELRSSDEALIEAIQWLWERNNA